MPKLYHYADISSINSKTPASGGLGPSFIGTEKWNIAKSKLDAAKNFSVHVREQNQAKRSPAAKLNRTLESHKKPDQMHLRRHSNQPVASLPAFSIGHPTHDLYDEDPFSAREVQYNHLNQMGNHLNRLIKHK